MLHCLIEYHGTSVSFNGHPWWKKQLCSVDRMVSSYCGEATGKHFYIYSPTPLFFSFPQCLVPDQNWFSSNWRSNTSLNRDKVMTTHLKSLLEIRPENVAPKPGEAADLCLIVISSPIDGSNLPHAALELLPRQILSHSRHLRPTLWTGISASQWPGRIVLGIIKYPDGLPRKYCGYIWSPYLRKGRLW